MDKVKIQKWRKCFSIIVVVFTAVLLSGFYYLIGNSRDKEISLFDPDADITLWNGYTAWKDTPELTGGLGMTFPGEKKISAVKIREKLPKKGLIANAKLRFSVYGTGVDVFLDDERIYTDFISVNSTKDSFILSENIEQEYFKNRKQEISVELGNDYEGKILTITYYFQKDQFVFISSFMYPKIVSYLTDAGNLIDSVVYRVISMTFSGILVIGLSVLFLLGVKNGVYEWNFLWMIMYYICMIIRKIVIGFNKMDVYARDRLYGLYFLGVSMIPLLVIAGNKMQKQWIKRIFYLTAVSQTVLYAFYLIADVFGENFYIKYHSVYVEMMQAGVFFLMVIIEYLDSWPDLKKKILKALGYILLGMTVAFFWILAGDQEMLYYLKRAVQGDIVDVVFIGAEIIFFVLTIVLIEKIISKVIDIQRKNIRYEQSVQLAMEKEKLNIQTIQQVREARHEILHHVYALAGFLNDKQYQKAQDYINELVRKAEDIPQIKYCDHMQLNNIAVVYADRMKQNKVKFQFHLLVPPNVMIDDADLSMLVSNVMDNAMEAALKVEEKRRYVSINMRMNGRLLMLEESNSADGNKIEKKDGSYGTTKKNKLEHGIGLGIIRKIVKKYEGYMKIEYNEDSFKIVLYLNVGVIKNKI